MGDFLVTWFKVWGVIVVNKRLYVWHDGHENTWRNGIQYFMPTNRNACATLQNQGRDYQNIEILCWMFSDEHKPPYFRTPHCFKH